MCPCCRASWNDAGEGRWSVMLLLLTQAADMKMTDLQGGKGRLVKDGIVWVNWK